jgi:hypothetical protein
MHHVTALDSVPLTEHLALGAQMHGMFRFWTQA